MGGSGGLAELLHLAWWLEHGVVRASCMLRTLRERSHLPVPTVVYESDTLLVMERLASGGALDGGD